MRDGGEMEGLGTAGKVGALLLYAPSCKSVEMFNFIIRNLAGKTQVGKWNRI